ncbi:MAG: DNA translocase FtsK 4TM domain-containing protein [Pseudomonadota bacterium]
MEFSKKDIVGVVFLVLAIFTGFAVYTYNATDPSFNAVTISEQAQNSAVANPAVKNMSGLIGSYTSDILLAFTGLSAFILPLAFLLTAIFIFYRSGKRSFSYTRAGAVILLLLCVSISMDVITGTVTYRGGEFAAGGWLGKSLISVVGPYLSRIGTAIICVIASLLLLFYLVNYSFATGMAIFVFSLYKTITVSFKGFYRTIKWMIRKFSGKEAAVGGDYVDGVSLKDKIKKKTTAKTPAKDDAEEMEAEMDVMKRKPTGKYKLPSVELLNKVAKTKTKDDITELENVAKSLQARLKDFDVEGEVVEVCPGPVITMYEFKPAPGVKINKVANLSDDLALALGCGSLRVIAPIPGKSVIGIEVPNKNRETVYIRELIDSNLFKTADKKIPIAVGKDTEGNPYVTDLTNMPHLLVAGSTGSGKSVFVNSFICSLLYKFTPDEVKMLMIDPKMLELSIYDGIPHLLHPVVTEAPKAARALKWALREMTERYTLMASKNARSIVSYNAEAETPLPYIVIIVDELADLMMVSSKDVETSITRLAQMARAAGIHLVVATQRPSVDVITGLIKANFPARISFKTASRVDSRTILDVMGAEKLLGKGDMLLLPPGTARLERLHGAFVSDDEVKKVVDYVKTQGTPEYKQDVVEEEEIDFSELDGDSDELYGEAVKIVAETRKASISYIQRRLRIGYNRAARIVELMEKNGVVSPELSSGRREVLINN